MLLYFLYTVYSAYIYEIKEGEVTLTPLLVLELLLGLQSIVK